MTGQDDPAAYEARTWLCRLVRVQRPIESNNRGRILGDCAARQVRCGNRFMDDDVSHSTVDLFLGTLLAATTFWACGCDQDAGNAPEIAPVVAIESSKPTEFTDKSDKVTATIEAPNTAPADEIEHAEVESQLELTLPNPSRDPVPEREDIQLVVANNSVEQAGIPIKKFRPRTYTGYDPMALESKKPDLSVARLPKVRKLPKRLPAVGPSQRLAQLSPPSPSDTGTQNAPENLPAPAMKLPEPLPLPEAILTPPNPTSDSPANEAPEVDAEAAPRYEPVEQPPAEEKPRPKEEADFDTMALPPDHQTAVHQTPRPVSAPVPHDAGMLPELYRNVTLQEVLRYAMSNAPVLRPFSVRVLDSPSQAVTVYDRAITVSDPFFGEHAALAEFDGFLSGAINSQNNDRVFNNATLGGQVQELTQDLVNMNLGWQRTTQTGATWDVSAQTLYDNNNRAGNSFQNYWETQFTIGARQPLLRGAGEQFNRIAGPNAQPGFNFSNGIVIAKLNSKISAIDFQIGIQTFVRDVYIAYWSLQQHYQNLDSVIAARDIAHRTWQATLAKKESKLIGADKESQARARYYRYVREVQNVLGGDAGQGGLYSAERRLRKMVGLPINEHELIKPAEEFNNARYVFDYHGSVAAAASMRPELKRQTLRVHQEKLRLTAAKNFLLPQLDLIGRYRLRGFGDDLTGGGSRFSSAGEDFFSLDHQEFEFGVEMGVPYGRRQAKTAVRNACLKVNKEQSILDEQHRDLELEVSDAIAEVNSSYFALETSLEQVKASRERLQATEALFEAGKIEIEFMLEAQEELLRVELQLSGDQLRYVLSIVGLNKATGSLLPESGVNMASH